jgi:cytochrome c oxidase subunit 1/cytochrome c oxidase subunit I+III
MTDTYYVVAHFHYVLFGGTLFGMLAGLYYWFPKMSGRMLSEGLGKWQFWLTVLGFNLTFFVQHFLGFMGMPRRVYTYPDLPGWGSVNLLSTIGAFMLGFAMLLLGANILWSLLKGSRAPENPWDAWTLEWATSSPPPEENFERVPPIRGRRPLWDLAHPGEADLKSTSAPLSGPGLPEKGVIAMTVFIISEGFFFLMLVIAYLFFNHAPGPGPTAASSLSTGRTSLFTACLLASSVTLWLSERASKRRDPAAMRRWLASTILLGLVFLIGQAAEYWELFHHGVTVDKNLFAASFFTLTGFHGLHVTLGLIALGVLLWLVRGGDARAVRSPAFAPLGLYWHFVDGVWVVVFTVIYTRLLT